MEANSLAAEHVKYAVHALSDAVAIALHEQGANAVKMIADRAAGQPGEACRPHPKTPFYARVCH